MDKPIIKKSKISYLWFIPLITLLIGLGLGWQHLATRGPTIEIVFKDAGNMQEGKTKIRFKEIDIGTIESINFSEDFKKVIVTAQMTRTAAPLLRSDTQFWLVSTQITPSGITGLNTLISGSYIAIKPGQDKEKSHHFVAMDEAPLIQPYDTGINIELQSSQVNGLRAGSPIVFKGMTVGRVQKISFFDDFSGFRINAFIAEPYDQLIQSNTQFWNISGFQFNASAGGINLQASSLETVLLGGITFTTPGALDPQLRAQENSQFHLFNNEQDATRNPMGYKEYFVIYLNESVRGLSINAPVEFNGIYIGKVTDVQLVYNEESGELLTPIILEIDSGLIKSLKNNVKIDRDHFSRRLRRLIVDGLYASLQTSSYVTGSKYIALSMGNPKPQEPQKDEYTQLTIIPSRSGGSLDAVSRGIGEIIDKINQIPFAAMSRKIDSLLSNLQAASEGEGVRKLGQHLQESFTKLNKTLESFHKAGQSADQTLREVNSQLKLISTDLREVLQSLSPDSPFYYNLNQLLKSLETTSESIHRISRDLEKKPNALIMGK